MTKLAPEERKVWLLLKKAGLLTEEESRLLDESEEADDIEYCRLRCGFNLFDHLSEKFCPNCKGPTND